MKVVSVSRGSFGGLALGAVIGLLVVGGEARGQATHAVPSQFGSIQSAIVAAQAGDTILVDPGVYIENVSFLGKAITVRSVGGSAVTTIDGNQTGSCVRFVNAETRAAILDGFTLTNGSGTATQSGAEGGGIYCSASAPTIMNCTIVNNSATGFCIACQFPPYVGAAISTRNQSNPKIEGCYIGPQAFGTYGVIFVRQSSIEVISSIISPGFDLGLTIYGAGTFGGSNQVIVRNCVFEFAAYAAINFSPQSNQTMNAIVERCIFQNNQVAIGVGDNFVSLANIVVSECIFSGNGAVPVSGSNVSPWAIVCSDDQPLVLSGCTVSGNLSATAVSGNVSIERSIVHGNANIDVSPYTVFNFTISPTAVDSCVGVSVGLTGTGIINSDPLFVNPAGFDFRLSANSPCIDAVTSAVTILPGSVDFLGTPVPFYAAADMGAYEYVSMAFQGNVGPGSTPEALLTINGSSAVATTVPIGSTLTISLSQPTANPFPADFGLWLHVGPPARYEEVALPFGAMTFAPAGVPSVSSVPWILPSFNAGPTPWSYTLPNGFLFPAVMTLQGLIVENPATPTVRVTNAIILAVN